MPDLTALVGSRICHDLISPLGAIGNGMELLAMTAGTGQSGSGSEEMALIADSVARANARIRMFRLAFGAAGDGTEVSGAELAGSLQDNYDVGRITARAEGLPAALPRSLAKAGLLAALCAETALPRGGTLTLTHARGGLAIAAEGPRLDLDARLWDPLARGRPPAEDLRAAEVQFALLPAAVADARRSLRLEREETHLRLVL